MENVVQSDEDATVTIVDDMMEDASQLDSPQSSCTTPVVTDEGAFHSDTMAAVQLPQVLRHHVFKDGDWKLKLTQSHPTIKLTVFTRNLDYEHFGIKLPPMKTNCNHRFRCTSFSLGVERLRKSWFETK